MLALLLPAALAADPDPLLRPEDRTAILQALAAADLTVPDLSFEKDYVQSDGVLRDPWRLQGIEALLHAPLSMPADAAHWSDLLSAQAPSEPWQVIRALYESRGFLMRTTGGQPVRSFLIWRWEPRPSACAPAEKRAWGKLDPELQAAVCALVGVEAPRVDAGGYLPAEAAETLVAMARPDSEDAWSPSEAQRRVREFLAATKGFDLLSRTSAATHGASRLSVLAPRLAAIPAERWPAAIQSFTFGDRVVQVGSPGMDTFTAAFTLDPGGDDRHLDPSGVGLSLHLDLAGDDLWQGGDGTLGGSIGGAAVLWDAAGDDSYRSSGVGSIGAGVGGVGLLWDGGGDDSYRGVATTQGAAMLGIGLLADAGGRDSYDAGAYAQGYAGTLGQGALWDGGGDDAYRAGGTYPDMPTRFPDHTLSLSQGFSIGLRPDAGGGLGLLVDESGNDSYDADLFAQGCSYWFSRGYLVDRMGNDRYHVYQYGQGSGIHLSVAGLFDLAGKDVYAGGNLLQGSSHDFSVGWLYDRAGDDLYSGNSTAQGGSLTNSATFLLDVAGDDAYSARQPASRGQGRYDRNMGSIGVFVDAAGTDHYDGWPADGQIARPWAYGVAVDDVAALPPPDPELPPPPLRKVQRPDPAAPTPQTGRPVASAEVLAALAAADSVTCQDPPACEVARKALIAEGPAAFERLLVALPRDILSESYTLDAVFQGLRSPENDPRLYAIIMAHVQGGPAYPSERWAINWLGALGREPLATSAALAPLARDPNPRLRNALATALLSWKLRTPELDLLLADPEEAVRAVSVLALGASGAPAEQLTPHLRDPSALVRFNAAEVLLGRAPESVRAALVAEWRGAAFPTPASRRLVLELLIRAGGKDAAAIVAEVARSDADPWAQRKAAAAAEPRFPWRGP